MKKSRFDPTAPSGEDCIKHAVSRLQLELLKDLSLPDHPQIFNAIERAFVCGMDYNHWAESSLIVLEKIIAAKNG